MLLKMSGRKGNEEDERKIGDTGARSWTSLTEKSTRHRLANWENMSPHKPNLISLVLSASVGSSRACKHPTETKEELKRAGTIPF